MNKTTADDIRLWSRVDWVKMGYPAPSAGSPDPLDIEIDRANAYIASVTGKSFQDVADGSDDETRYDEAVQLRVEQVITQRQKGYLSDLHNDAVDISVEGYSSKRVSPSDRTPKNMVNPAPRLNELLWELMTDEKKAEWKALLGIAPNEPAEAIVYPDWGYPPPDSHLR